VLLSNWRHALLAVLGAVIGATVSSYDREVSDLASINLGLYGFNGVLAAVSVFVFCGGKLRLAILGALVATILVPVIPAFGVKALAAPFVLTTWTMLALGWIEERWLAAPAPAPSSRAQLGSRHA
jgi:urea transporter